MADKVNFLLILLLSFGCFSQKMHSAEKINGISIWSDVKPIDNNALNSIEHIGANWISLQPYGVVWSDTGTVEFDLKNAWECSSFDGLRRNIRISKQNGYKVFLKPHLILKYKKLFSWEGRMRRGSKKSWKTLEDSYAKFILSLAHIADSMDVELFSVGTELGTFPRRRQLFWTNLIDSVRTIYSNELTFCANFDAYQKFPFWEQLDYIGIDAYFTTSLSRTPSVDRTMKKWRSRSSKLKKFSNKNGRKILFTEYGYRSVDYAAFQPWRNNVRKTEKNNFEAQANAYQALFDSIWNENWFKGGFSWLWKLNVDPDPTDYEPRSKPAEKVISEVYQRYR